MTTEDRWENIRQLLSRVNTTKVIASLFVHTPLDSIPLDSQVLHGALLRLKEQNEEFGELLDDFIFTFKGPFPISIELDDAIPRLTMSRLISIPNPEYKSIFLNKRMRACILEQEKKWFGEDSAKKIEQFEEMGKQFSDLLKKRESELKEREAKLVTV